jgi:hypothetical protein
LQAICDSTSPNSRPSSRREASAGTDQRRSSSNDLSPSHPSQPMPFSGLQRRPIRTRKKGPIWTRFDIACCSSAGRGSTCAANPAHPDHDPPRWRRDRVHPSLPSALG